MPVFNRYRRFRTALDAIAIGGGDQEKALATNFYWEPRVEWDREQEFDNDCGQPRTSDELRVAIDKYYKYNVRDAVHPFFLRDANRNNVVYDPVTSSTPLFTGTEQLCTVLDLTGLEKAIAEEIADGTLPPVGYVPVPDGWKLYLENLRTNSSATVGEVFRVLNARNSRKPFHPTWCTRWAAFEHQFAGQPALRWMEALGLGIEGKTFPRWLALMRYDFAQTAKVLRPTQLDCPWEKGGWHFPSPPNRALREGGLAMDLGGGKVSAHLPEYIHTQLAWDVAWLVRVEQATLPTAYDPQTVREARLRHRTAVGDSSGANAPADWMPSPI